MLTNPRHCRSGLRGAVGLALSLFVLLDDAIGDKRFRVLTFFYMGAMAFLTLMVQGTTTPLLLRVRSLFPLRCPARSLSNASLDQQLGKHQQGLEVTVQCSGCMCGCSTEVPALLQLRIGIGSVHGMQP